MSKYVILRGPQTGYQHDKCYARADNNCSTKISKEHFISKKYLKQIQLNDTAKIAGLSWQSPEKFSVVPIKGLSSNILCDRHNSALSPLDAEFGSFTETVRNFDRRNSTGLESWTVPGCIIELWMLKCLLGLASSGNIRCTFKPDCVDILFGRSAWPAGWGLYFSDTQDNPIYHTNSLLIEILVAPDIGLLLAARFYIQGLPFVLVLGKPDNPRSAGVWRPCEVAFKSPTSEKKIVFSWDAERCGGPIELTCVGRYDGPPPIWKKWEREG